MMGDWLSWAHPRHRVYLTVVKIVLLGRARLLWHLNISLRRYPLLTMVNRTWTYIWLKSDGDGVSGDGSRYE